MSGIQKNIIKFSTRVNNNNFPAKFCVDVGTREIVQSIKPSLTVKSIATATLTVYFAQNERDDCIMETGGFYECLWKEQDWEGAAVHALREVDPDSKWAFDEKKLMDNKYEKDEVVFLPGNDAVLKDFRLYQSVFTLPLVSTQ